MNTYILHSTTKQLEQIGEEYKQEKSKRESDLLEATEEISS